MHVFTGPAADRTPLQHTGSRGK